MIPGTKREIPALLRRANALETHSLLQVGLEEALRERAQAAQKGFAMSMGTSMPGAVVLAPFCCRCRTATIP